jgi:hypothetical protein
VPDHARNSSTKLSTQGRNVAKMQAKSQAYRGVPHP